MKIEIRDINELTFEDLLSECKGCLYWEAPEEFGNVSTEMTNTEATEIKRNWFITTNETMGSSGKILYDDGEAAGYAQYAFPRFLECAAEYAEGLFPVSPDAVLLSCLYIRAGHQNKGLGTKLLQAVLEELRERGYKALETYARDESASNSSGPTALYLENGFRAIKTGRWGNRSYSLMRYELS